MTNHVKSEKRPAMQPNEVGFSATKKDRSIFFERETGKEKRGIKYDSDKCNGCGLCLEVCPTEAIELGPIGAIQTAKLDSTKIIISPQKCVLCGMCAAVCMFNAIDMGIDAKSMKNSPDYLKFKRDFKFSQEKCKMKNEAKNIICKDCEEACPTEAIEAKLVKSGNKLINTISMDEKKCIYCSACEIACPQDAIEVEKVFDGLVDVDLDKCQGCGACWEACPTKAITSPKPKSPGEKPKKVEVNQEICIFCGACEKSCPVEAIKVNRKKVHYIKEKEKSWTARWEKAFNALANEGN